MIEDQLDLFLLAYRAPTFSAAAAQVPMTPQGFTKAVKKLENDLGVPLFETDEHGSRRPTAYADELFVYAKHARAEREALNDTFERIKNSEQVSLKVACAVGIPGLFGVEAMQGFSEMEAGASISYSEFPDALCDSLVIDGTFDVGITLSPAREELRTVPLFESPVLIWVNVSDPLSGRESLGLEDLSGRKMAMPGRGFRVYDNLMGALREQGIEPPDIVEYSEIFWIYYFVLSGKGIGFCLPHLADLEMFDGNDEMVAIPLEGMKWRVCFSWPKARELRPVERGYLEYLRKRIARRG